MEKVNGDIPFVVYFGLSEEKTNEEIAQEIESYQACGKNLFTLAADLMRELLNNRERIDSVLEIYKSHNASCRCAHSDWGEGNEISLPFEGDRKRMLERCAKMLELTAMFGGDTCTFHAETWSNDSYRPRTREQWRSYIMDSLEYLVPFAEKYNS